jgi:hypothetical protein
MSEQKPESKSLDLLGIKPAAQAVDRATEATIQGASAFLSRICLPAAAEFGLLLKDRVSNWRAIQAAKIAEKAQTKINFPEGALLTAHPRLVWEIIEKGSWSDDDIVQGMWAGLLASSCTPDAPDDRNVLFSGLLAQLSGIQVRILKFSCEASKKFASMHGFPLTEGPVRLSNHELCALAGTSDQHRLDCELDHLRSLELIGGPLGMGGGFNATTGVPEIWVTALALYLFVRCQGFQGSPVDYWHLKTNPVS